MICNSDILLIMKNKEILLICLTAAFLGNEVFLIKFCTRLTKNEETGNTRLLEASGKYYGPKQNTSLFYRDGGLNSQA